MESDENFVHNGPVVRLSGRFAAGGVPGRPWGGLRGLAAQADHVRGFSLDVWARFHGMVQADSRGASGGAAIEGLGGPGDL